jgi:hypothetical protein
VAMILVKVVPNRDASTPPRMGVHVEFRLSADTIKLNSALFVPISRCNRDFRGPNRFFPLQLPYGSECLPSSRCSGEYILVASNTKRTGTKQS